MPSSDDEVRAAELKQARAEGRLEALEELEAERRKDRPVPGPVNRLRRGLEATNKPKTDPKETR